MSDRKPVGGIHKVSLYDAEAVLSVTREGSVSRLTLRSGAEVLTPRLIEEQSSLQESLHCDTKPMVVERQLALSIPRAVGEELFTPAQLRRAIHHRWVAVVELIDGSRILVGWSEQLQREAALRTDSVALSSGAKRSDLPTCCWRLVGLDTELAMPYSDTEITYASTLESTLPQ